jgi:anti-sigma factor RsiW
MKCDEAKVLVHALADGELDASHAREVEAHIASCGGCAAELAVAQDTRRALARQRLSYAAPATLREAIDNRLPRPVRAATRRAMLKGFAMGGAASALAATLAGVAIFHREDDNRIFGEAISAHLRSLQADHLVDVMSTDRHTVKPWFNGRIDIAPPVIDLAAQGFTLIGGRLDYIDGKPVAALVYRRRVHVINMFVGQRLGFTPSSPKFEIVQGFNVLHWNEMGLDLLAVSDLNREELEDVGSKCARAIKAAAAS